MTFRRFARSTLSALALATLALAGTGAAPAAAYPDKPITVLAGFPPGGNVDITIRNAQPFLEKYLGGQITVVNKPGAAAALAYTELAHSPPDGYTLAMTSLPGGLATQFGTERRYDVDSFEWIANFTEEPFTIFVHPDSPYKTLEDMLEDARKRPGQVNLAGAGSFGSPHLGLLAFQRVANVKFNWVPMQGSAPMRTAVLGRHVDGGVTSVSVSASMEREGQIRILCMMSEERWDQIPDVKTCKELGYPIEWTASRGLKAPAGTPKEIVDMIAEASRKTIADPEFQKVVDREGLLTRYLGPKEYRQYVEKQNDMLKEMWASDPWR